MMMNYNQLYAIVDGVSLDENSLISYNGIEFIIKYFNRKCESDSTAIAWMQLTEPGRKCLVLIANGLTENERRLSLLHEIVEVCLMQYHGYKREGAHEIALMHEANYTQRGQQTPKPNCV